jgi:hypothetical protein
VIHGIPAWMDRDGRVWLDTGQTDPVSQDPFIELLNGEIKGALHQVAKRFGPLQSLTARRAAGAEKRA